MTTEAEILYAAPQKLADRMEAIYQQLADEHERWPDYRKELVYIDYRDQLDDEQVSALACQDWEKLDASLDEWLDETRWMGAREAIAELLKDADLDEEEVERFRDSDWYDELRFVIEERDTSEPLKELASHSSPVLMRVTVIDEDDSLSFQEVHARDVLERIGLPCSDTNIETMYGIIDNASPEFTVCMGFWLFEVHPRDIYDWKPETTKLRVTNPGFWLGSPFSGSGYADQLEGSIYIERADLRTDKQAWGYGWGEVVGGYCFGNFEVEIEEVK